MYLSIGQAAAALGISVSTLRRWEFEGFLTPSFRTVGGHRRYSLPVLEETFRIGRRDDVSVQRVAVAYARVSSHDQASDLETQAHKLQNFCAENFPAYEVIKDLGSGLNYKKPGLRRLLRLIFLRRIHCLVLNHKDRLLRFGSEIIFEMCRHFGVQVIVLEDQVPQSFEQELVNDVIELMTVFSSRLYGRRSHRNRKALAA